MVNITGIYYKSIRTRVYEVISNVHKKVDFLYDSPRDDLIDLTILITSELMTERSVEEVTKDALDRVEILDNGTIRVT